MKKQDKFEGLSNQEVRFIKKLDRDALWHYALFGLACIAVMALIVSKNIN